MGENIERLINDRDPCTNQILPPTHACCREAGETIVMSVLHRTWFKPSVQTPYAYHRLGWIKSARRGGQ
jgi:hypothetical protein